MRTRSARTTVILHPAIRILAFLMTKYNHIDLITIYKGTAERKERKSYQIWQTNYLETLFLPEFMSKYSNMKQIGIWAGIIVIFFATTWGLITLVNNRTVASTQVGTPPGISKNDQVLGVSTGVKAVLIEYADFQCLACKNYAVIVRQLKKDFGDDLLIAYRFFPLVNSHQNAMSSSQAAFAASKQNKFWEMSDMLYENQENWATSTNPESIFIEYAKKLNLDLAQFTSDYNDQATKNFIIDQLNSGLSIGINYTPTFFLNGKIITNPQSYAAFKQLIQDEINQK